MCAGLGELCFRDERCSSITTDPFEGLGCNAGGVGQLCRFCGFDDFPACPDPSPSLVSNFTINMEQCPTVCGNDPVEDQCFFDPTCSESAPGCNAGGSGEFCRFCGGDGEPACPCLFNQSQASVSALTDSLDSNGVGNFAPDSTQVSASVVKVTSFILESGDANISFAQFDVFSFHAAGIFCSGSPSCSVEFEWNDPPMNALRRPDSEGVYAQNALLVTLTRKLEGCDDSAELALDAKLHNGTALIQHIVEYLNTNADGAGASFLMMLSLQPGSVSNYLMALLSVTTMNTAYSGVTDPVDRADDECDLFQATVGFLLNAIPTRPSTTIQVDMAYEGALARSSSTSISQGQEVPCDITQQAVTYKPSPPPPEPTPPPQTTAPPPVSPLLSAPPTLPTDSGPTSILIAEDSSSILLVALAGFAILFCCVMLLCCGRWRRLALPSDDIAREKPVATSSYEDGSCRPDNAVDGSSLTYWSSGPVGDTDQQWIAVDLLETFNLAEVRVTWESGPSQQYLIQGSMDALVWRTLRQVTPAQQGTQAVQVVTDLSGRQARFVRLLCLKLPVDEAKYMIRAIEVYGVPAGPEDDAASPLETSGLMTPASDPQSSVTPEDQLVSEPGAISWSEVQLTELLGSSRSDFGHVYRGSYQNKTYAVRRLGPQTFAAQGLQSVQDEVATLSALEHPCLLRIIGFISDGLHNRGVLMEFRARSLQDILESPFAMSLDWQTAWLGISIGIADGMAYLHSKSILHSCLRPHNIMLDDQLAVKITDYGRDAKMLAAVRLSINQADEESEQSGEPTQAYSAPEVLHGGSDVDKSVDSWSFGCILARLGSGVPLYSTVGDVSWYILMLRVCSGQVTPLSELRQATECPKEIFLLATHCLNLDPAKRLSFARIKLLLTRIPSRMSATGDASPRRETPQGDPSESPGGDGAGSSSGSVARPSGRRASVSAAGSSKSVRRVSVSAIPDSTGRSATGARRKSMAPAMDARRGSVHVMPARLPGPALLEALATPAPAPPEGQSPTPTSVVESPASTPVVDDSSIVDTATESVADDITSIPLPSKDDTRPGTKQDRSDAGSSSQARHEVVLGESAVKSKQIRAGRVRI